MFNLLISFGPNSNHILWEKTKTLVITQVLINEQLYFNFGYYSMGYSDIGYHVTLGIMSHWVLCHIGYFGIAYYGIGCYAFWVLWHVSLVKVIATECLFTFSKHSASWKILEICVHCLHARKRWLHKYSFGCGRENNPLGGGGRGGGQVTEKTLEFNQRFKQK